jgi:MFS transporter, AAHS family, benzoate transport protein
MKTMPESMPFLIKKNRDAELRRIVRKLAPNYPLQENEQFMVPAEDRATSAPVAKLFHDGRGFSTVMIWVAFFMGLFMVYALSSWLTKLMAMAGYSLGSALTFTIVFNLNTVQWVLIEMWSA